MLGYLTKFIDLVFENACLICNSASSNTLVCKSCEDDFVERKNNYTKNFSEITVYSWGLYDSKLRQGIISLKAKNKKLALYFAKKLAVFWEKVTKSNESKKYLVIPVPSHKKRIKERGYCQASLIAQEFAFLTNADYTNELVIRAKETVFMNDLENISKRLENIKGAFEISDRKFERNNILIIDDILTSGSTLCELARALRKVRPELNLTGLTVASGDTYDF